MVLIVSSSVVAAELLGGAQDCFKSDNAVQCAAARKKISGSLEADATVDTAGHALVSSLECPVLSRRLYSCSNFCNAQGCCPTEAYVRTFRHVSPALHDFFLLCRRLCYVASAEVKAASDLVLRRHAADERTSDKGLSSSPIYASCTKAGQGCRRDLVVELWLWSCRRGRRDQLGGKIANFQCPRTKSTPRRRCSVSWSAQDLHGCPAANRMCWQGASREQNEEATKIRDVQREQSAAEKGSSIQSSRQPAPESQVLSITYTKSNS
ncbi:hypothetical protein EK21DRAFT_88220 [Setomelanomma holmii]|uniref:Uncharacterized protein n=1 Tax=Setomelanomma holmii TaxID=210430 RepID=A0A9P4HDF2_9PLEO|nr:hypothetical protein EK21DRAFT_88220 [Setomelanomma holmii]